MPICKMHDERQIISQMGRLLERHIPILEKLNCVGLRELGPKHYLQASFVIATPFLDSVRDILEQCRSRLL